MYGFHVRQSFSYYDEEVCHIDKAYIDPGKRTVRLQLHEYADSIDLSEFSVEDQIGIYEYLLSGNEKTLNIRAFTDSQKLAAYERQKGICPRCMKYYELIQMHGDHITPWSKGGKTSVENLQMLCEDCNRKKSNV